MPSRLHSSLLPLTLTKFLSVALFGALATQGCASRKFNQPQKSEGSAFVANDKQGNTLVLVPVQRERADGEHGVCWYLATAPAPTDAQAELTEEARLKEFLVDAVSKKSFVRLPVLTNSSGITLKEAGGDVVDVTADELLSTRETRLDTELMQLMKDREKLVSMNERWKEQHAQLSQLRKHSIARDKMRALFYAGEDAVKKAKSIDVEIAQIKKARARTAGTDLAKEGQTHSMDETKPVQSEELVYLNAYLRDHQSTKSSSKGAPCPTQPEFGIGTQNTGDESAQ